MNDIHALPLGHQIGPYRIHGVLDHRALGTSYLARHHQTPARVRIEHYLPKPHLTDTNPTLFAEGRAAFLATTHALQNVRHPNLATIIESFDDGESLYRITDYSSGITLAEHLNRQDTTLAYDQVVKIIKPIIAALTALHQAGIPHLNITAENILLRHQQGPLLSGFDTTAQTLTTHNITHDHANVPPEPANGHPPSIASDVYALGACLYRCFSGTAPLKSTTRQKQIKQNRPDPLIKLNNKLGKHNIPGNLVGLIDQALQLDPGTRPPLSAIDAALTDTPVLSTSLPTNPIATPSPPTTKPIASPVLTPPTATRNTPQPAPQKPRAPFALLATVILISGLFIGIISASLYMLFLHENMDDAKLDFQFADYWQTTQHNITTWFDDLLHDYPNVDPQTTPPPAPTATTVADADDADDTNTPTLIPPQPLETNAPASKDTENYRQAQQQNTVDAYLNYLTNCTRCAHFDAAQAAINTLQDQPEPSIAADTDAAFSIAEPTRTEEPIAPNEPTAPAESDDIDFTTAEPTKTQPPKSKLSGHRRNVWSAAFSPNGEQIISGSSDRTLKLWNTRTGKADFTLKGHNGYISTVAFHPNGQQVASASGDETIRLWNTQTGRRQRTLTGQQGDITSLAYSTNGKKLVSGADDRTIRIWDTQTGKQLQKFTGHENGIADVAFSPNGKHVVSAGGYDQTVLVWNSNNGQNIATLKHDDHIYAVAYAPNGKQIAVAGADKKVHLWDTANYQKRQSLAMNSRVLAVAYSNNGNYLAGGDTAGKIIIWNTRNQKIQQKLTGPGGGIRSLSFSPDNQYIAIASRTSKQVKIVRID